MKRSATSEDDGAAPAGGRAFDRAEADGGRPDAAMSVSEERAGAAAGAPVPGRVARPTVGIAFKVSSALVFTIMTALIKLLGDRIPTGEIVFARNFFALVPVLLVILVRGELFVALRTHRPLGHFGRAVVGMTAMFLGFASIARLPLADATAIGYAAPLITVGLAVILLKEKVRATRWVAVSVGLAGVLIVLSPHLSGVSGGGREMAGALFAITAAFFVAFAMIFIRTLTGTEHTTTIVLYFTLSAAGLSLLTAPFGWVMPSPGDAALLVLVGMLGGVGQFLLTQSYRYADASVIAPFEYTTMVWTLIAGALVFHEVPSPVVVLGAAIIVGAGIVVVVRERRLGLSRPERGPAGPPAG